MALTNNFQQADTGTKMIHLGKNTKSTIISKGISAGKGQQTYRGEVGYYTDVFVVGVLFYWLLSGGELPYQVIEVDDEDEEGDGKTKRELDYYIAPVHPSVHNPQDFSDALLLAAADLLH